MATTNRRVADGAVALGRVIAQRRLGGIDGVHVHVRGQRPVEHHWTPDVRRDVFSVSKTFVSVAVGIAEAEGLLRVSDLALNHLDNVAPAAAPGAELITIQHLLTMTSGIVYRWDGTNTDPPGDPAQHLLASPLATEPGTTFAYRGGNSYLLGRIIHSCSGLNVLDFLHDRLFTPLGIESPSWQRCPLGFPLGAVGLSLRTEEIARLGQTLLDRGSYRGRQLVPADYVASLTSDPVSAEGHQATGASGPHPENARYGRHVWLCTRDNGWRMDGIYGQFSVVLPRQKGPVTVTGHYQGPTTDILDAIWSHIVPELR